MTFKLWMIGLVIQSLAAFGLFGYQFKKNKSYLKTQEYPIKSIVIHWSLIFIGITSVSIDIYLFMNWQEQIQYFLNR